MMKHVLALLLAVSWASADMLEDAQNGGCDDVMAALIPFMESEDLMQFLPEEYRPPQTHGDFPFNCAIERQELDTDRIIEEANARARALEITQRIHDSLVNNRSIPKTEKVKKVKEEKVRFSKETEIIRDHLLQQSDHQDDYKKTACADTIEWFNTNYPVPMAELEALYSTGGAAKRGLDLGPIGPPFDVTIFEAFEIKISGLRIIKFQVVLFLDTWKLGEDDEGYETLEYANANLVYLWKYALYGVAELELNSFAFSKIEVDFMEILEEFFTYASYVTVTADSILFEVPFLEKGNSEISAGVDLDMELNWTDVYFYVKFRIWYDCFFGSGATSVSETINF